MKPLRFFLAAMLCTAALSGAALAEEEEAPEIRFEDVPEYVPQEEAGRWYLRADFGTALSGGKLSGGAGIGYRFNDWLRADLTAELQQGERRSFSATSLADCGGGAGTGCRVTDRATARTLAAFANAYADLGTVAGFTPYVGAGVGVARLAWHDATRSRFCMDAAQNCSAKSLGSENIGGRKDWRFAYVANAGVAYDIGARMKVDFGYRFQSILSGGSSSDFRNKGYTQHQIRLGVRYLLP